MGDTQAASGSPEVTPKASREGQVREGFLEEVTMAALFSAVSPAQGDQLIPVCWGLSWFQHCKSHVPGDPSVLAIPGQSVILPPTPHWKGPKILDACMTMAFDQSLKNDNIQRYMWLCYACVGSWGHHGEQGRVLAFLELPVWWVTQALCPSHSR